MRTSAVLAALVPLAFVSCDGGTEPRECKEEEEVFVFVDADDDGFGVDPLGYTCAVGPNEAINSLDCDDNDATVSPDSPELCDGLDNNCDERIDEGLANTSYFADTDGDGFGDPESEVISCAEPGPGFVTNANDCDDENDQRYPGNVEICDNFIDEDCTGVADDIVEVCNDNIDNNCDGELDCNDDDCFSSPFCLQACADQALPNTEDVMEMGTFNGQTNDWTLMTDGCIAVLQNGADIALQWSPPTDGLYRVFVPNLPTGVPVQPTSLAILTGGCAQMGQPYDICDQPPGITDEVEVFVNGVVGENWIIILDSNDFTTDWEIGIELQ